MLRELIAECADYDFKKDLETVEAPLYMLNESTLKGTTRKNIWVVKM